MKSVLDADLKRSELVLVLFICLSLSLSLCVFRYGRTQISSFISRFSRFSFHNSFLCFSFISLSLVSALSCSVFLITLPPLPFLSFLFCLLSALLSSDSVIQPSFLCLTRTFPCFCAAFHVRSSFADSLCAAFSCNICLSPFRVCCLVLDVFCCSAVLFVSMCWLCAWPPYI